MTTIAWDGFILATDSQITNGDHIFGEGKKIHKLNDGRWFASAGSQDFTYAVIEWLNGGEKPDIKDNDNFIGLLISCDENCYPVLTEISANLRMWPAIQPWAGGSGEAYALTAMKCGKGAEFAVKVACDMDIYSGGQIQVMTDFDTR